MSTSSARAPGGTSWTSHVSWSGGLVVAELSLLFRRRRNLAMLSALVLAPVIVGLALRLSGTSPDGGGDGGGAPAFVDNVTGNGLFLGFSALVLLSPVFMPLVMAVVSGEAIAGEAASGTLRYLLTVPVARGRVLAVKYITCVAFGLVAAALVVTSGMVAGAALFPVGEVTLLSGTTVGFGEALGRATLMAGYATVMLAGLASIGLYISTLTEVPVAAMATTAAVPIVSQILGTVPQLSGLHPWLLTDTWQVYGDFLRDPVIYQTIERGLLTHLAYIAVFGSLAWARFVSRDITS